MTDVIHSRLADRVALVTGGARGQGAAHGRRLASEGATVYLGDVLDDDGEATARDLRDEGLDVRYAHLDVSDAEQWRHLYEHISTEHDRLDILVNNAGIVHVADLVDHGVDEWTRVLTVNLTGAFLGLKTMAPLLQRGTNPAVVNTASIFGPSGAPGYAAYAASKAGLVGLSRTAALEFAPYGIRVNSLVPGGVTTPLNAHEKSGGVIPETPLQRRADVTELAAAVAYLVSDDASFVTGTELVVDGGFSTR